jgi:hypothetical protein
MTDFTNPSSTAEKKIIVDEDWKTQVEREKSQAEQNLPKTPAEPKKPDSVANAPMPPATLSYLSGSLYYQAMISFGLMPNPGSGKPELNLPLAKHAIDMLDVLQQKTEGNRTTEESDELEAMLHQLRLTYVQLNK